MGKEILPDNQTNLTAVILIGGRSRRMGTDKAFLNYHGQSQLDYLLSIVKEMNLPYAVSCNSSQLPQLPSSYHPILDMEQDLGPISGIHTAMKQIQDNSILALPCDAPLLTADLLTKLISERTKNAEVTCFAVNDQLEPLPSIWDKSVQSKISAYLDNGGRGLLQFLSGCEVSSAQIAQGNLLKSANTSKEATEMRKLLSKAAE